MASAAFRPNREMMLGLYEHNGGWISTARADEAAAHVAAGLIAVHGAPDDEGYTFHALTPEGRKWCMDRQQQRMERYAREISSKPIPTVDVCSQFPEVSQEADKGAHSWNKFQRKTFKRREQNSLIEKALRLEELEIGESRHIACTESVPEPWKTYLSIVNVANKRHVSVLRDHLGKPLVIMRNVRNGGGIPRPFPILVYDKKFAIFQAKPNDPRGPGARIARIDPQNPTDY